MKTILSILIVSGGLWGCGLVSSNSDTTTGLTPSFTLTDTTGKPSDTFHSGEDFVLACSIKNTTGDTVVYHTGIPFIAFRIYGGDTVHSSADGCPVPALYMTVKLPPGKSVSGSWRGPSSICEPGTIRLLPGAYSAEAFYPVFDRVKIDTVMPIRFNVVQ